jgi:hypothetical protein
MPAAAKQSRRRAVATSTRARRQRATDRVLHEAGGLVVPERGEQVQLGGAPGELEERDPAAATGEHARLAQVRDVTGGRDRRDAAQRDVLDVADHGQAQGTRHLGSVPRSPASPRRSGRRVPASR